MKYVAFDPGGTTGIAGYRRDLKTGEDEFWTHYMGPEQHHKELFGFLHSMRLDEDSDFRVIIESFEYRNKAREGLVLVSVEYIGIVKLFCQENKIPYHSQTASQGKLWSTDDKLEKLGWLKTPRSRWPNQHINDAARHLLYFLGAVQKDKQILTALR